MTGAPKRCPQCGETKPLTEYYRNRGTRDGLTSWCKPCHGNGTRRWREQNPERARESSKLSHRRIREQHPERVVQQNATRRNRQINLKARFDMTPEQYDELLAAQGGVCAICGEHRVRNGRYSMHIDHDHETGVVRGILCHHCNLELGGFEDSPSRLIAAAAYLRQAARNPTGFALRRDGADRRKARR